MVAIETNIEYIKEKIDCMDKKYAPKWIVNVLSWAVGVLTVVFTAIIVKNL